MMDDICIKTRQRGEGDVLTALLARIAQGDDAALAELYDITSPLILGLALRIVRDRSAAEEITLEVYTRVWHQPAAFNPARGPVLSWILSIARTLAFDHSRCLQSPTALPDPLIHRFFPQLPADQQKVLELAFFEGLTHAEISSRTGLPLEVISTQIALAMLHLRSRSRDN
jgi:RNA polymerase sigma-70 factor, ECF subfamily